MNISVFLINKNCSLLMLKEINGYGMDTKNWWLKIELLKKSYIFWSFKKKCTHAITPGPRRGISECNIGVWGCFSSIHYSILSECQKFPSVILKLL